MKIYTRTGDTGQTSLFSGERVNKDHLRIEAYGSLDELNSSIGITLSLINILKNQSNMTVFCEDLSKKLIQVQNTLFVLGSHLATVKQESIKKLPSIDDLNITWFETDMDQMNAGLPALTNFILPGGGRISAQLHFSRTICRRAERLVVSIQQEEKIHENIIKYLNRLGDWLFVLARHANQAEGHTDQIWAKP
jgi:cob(I)alamin adenosyltransferase